MKGREIPARPARAIGSFSPSDMSSILDLKNSSGSLSLVSDFGAFSSSPNMDNEVESVEGVSIFLVLKIKRDDESVEAGGMKDIV